jgi:hypothetical protein
MKLYIIGAKLFKKMLFFKPSLKTPVKVENNLGGFQDFIKW